MLAFPLCNWGKGIFKNINKYMSLIIVLFSFLFSNFIWLESYCWYFHLLAFSFTTMFLKFMHVNCIVLLHFIYFHCAMKFNNMNIPKFIYSLTNAYLNWSQFFVRTILLLWKFLYTSLECMPRNWNCYVINYIYYMATNVFKCLLSLYI